MNTEPAIQTAAAAANTAAAAAPTQAAAANTAWDTNLSHWGYLALAILATYVLGKIIGLVFKLIGGQLKKKGRPATAELLFATGRTMGLFLLVVGLSVGMRSVMIPDAFLPLVHTVISVLFACVGGLYAWRLVEVATAAFEDYASKTPGKMDDMLVPIIRNGLRIVVVLLFIVQVVQIISHQQLSSVLAGLGIGGLAVALAAQDSIKNIFGSIVIIGDKPFMIEERIVVDGVDGIVEEVGLRSTRIRTMNGNLVTIPNGELANKTVENIGRRERIQRTFDLTLTYDMSAEKVRRAKEIVLEILAVGPNQQGRTEGGEVLNPAFPPRVFFKEFADFSMNISVLYWYNSTNYWEFMAYNEWFNFELLKRLNAEGIDMAFPTQTLYLAGDSKRPLSIGGLVPPQGSTKA